MNINIKEIDYCKFKVNYSADVLQILNKRNEVATIFSNNSTVPGFRKGKAPIDVIKHKYKDQVQEATKKALLEDAFHNTKFEHKLNVLGAPVVHTVFFDDAKFECEFDVSIKPTFDLINFKDLSIPKPHYEDDVVSKTQKTLEELRAKVGNLTAYTEDQFVEMGDRIIISYEGFIDNVKESSLSSEDDIIIVGSSHFKHFDENLLGMCVDETREFSIKSPDSMKPSLKDKDITFKVKLIAGSKVEPLGLNDELAHKYNVDTFENFQKAVQEKAFAAVENEKRNLLKDALNKKLIALHDFKVPEWLVESEAEYLAHSNQIHWAREKPEDKQPILKMAEGNVKLSLILDKVREEFPEAQLTDDQVFSIVKEQMIKNLVSQLRRKPTNVELKAEFDKVMQGNYLQVVFARIKDEYAMDFLLKTVSVVE